MRERRLEHFNILVFDSGDPVMIYANKVEKIPIDSLEDERCISGPTVKDFSTAVFAFVKNTFRRLL